MKTSSNLPAARLPELDGLRAIAILLVLLGHHLACAPVPWLRRVVEMGWVGVDLFFVLSGFLIGGILLDQRAAKNYYAVFYLRRFFRIVPLYALLVLPGILVLGLGWQTYLAGHSFANQSVTAIWFCPFFLQNVAWALALNIPAYLAPTWSVAVEEQFYLLLPPLIRNLDRKKIFRILWLAIFVAPVLRGLLIFALGDRATVACYVLLPCRWDSLLLGVVCAFAMREAALLNWLTDRLRHLQIFWWLSAAGSLAFLFVSQGHLDARMAFLGYTVIDVVFACTLLLAVVNQTGSLRRALSWPVFKPIAVISYGLYLIQSPMKAVIESLFRLAHFRYAAVSWPAVGVALVSLAATFFAAAVSWKFFESRLIRLGQQHAYQPAKNVGPEKISDAA
jgi:peptidoglycan/LPS O-acetylase OafA/YrhL